MADGCGKARRWAPTCGFVTMASELSKLAVPAIRMSAPKIYTSGRDEEFASRHTEHTAHDTDAETNQKLSGQTR